MTNKKLIINSFSECPHFDNEYWHYSQICEKLNKENKQYLKIKPKESRGCMSMICFEIDLNGERLYKRIKIENPNTKVEIVNETIRKS
jgi:hypothetical protein